LEAVRTVWIEPFGGALESSSPRAPRSLLESASMNLLGKIFTVLILLTSVVLMVVAMFVYSTHRNWQEAYNQLNSKLQAATTANANAEAEYLAQISQLK